MYDGDKVYWVYKLHGEVKMNSANWTQGTHGVLDSLTYFSSEELAKEYRDKLKSPEKDKWIPRIGDRVRIIKGSNSINRVGEEGVVTEIGGIGGTEFRVKVPGRDNYANWHTEEQVELITTEKKEVIVTKTIHKQLMKETTLKVGDVVKVTHKVPTHNLGGGAEWSPSMDKFIGANVTIVENRGNIGFKCKAECGSTWNFPVHVLEFVRKEVKTVTVKISEYHDAIVYSNKIEVGCQTITFEDFDKLAAIVAKQRNK